MRGWRLEGTLDSRVEFASTNMLGIRTALPGSSGALASKSVGSRVRCLPAVSCDVLARSCFACSAFCGIDCSSRSCLAALSQPCATFVLLFIVCLSAMPLRIELAATDVEIMIQVDRLGEIYWKIDGICKCV